MRTISAACPVLYQCYNISRKSHNEWNSTNTHCVSNHCCNCLWNCNPLFNAIISHSAMRIWGMIKNIREEILLSCSLSWTRFNRLYLMHNRNSLIILKWSENRHKWCGPKLVLYHLEHNKHFKVWELHMSQLHMTSHIICIYQSQNLTVTKFAWTGTRALSYFKTLSFYQRMGFSFKPTFTNLYRLTIYLNLACYFHHIQSQVADRSCMMHARLW